MMISWSELLALVVDALLNSTANSMLIVATGATLCGLSFTAGTLLLRRPLFLQRESRGEVWLRGFLGRAYSLGIDTNYHRTGILSNRYIDEFAYHKFPHFGVDRYSGSIPRTRPNFDFGTFLALELGSSLTVDDKPQPFEHSKVVEIVGPTTRLWQRVPRRIRGFLMSTALFKPLRYRLLRLSFPVYGKTQYNTVSYTLIPAKVKLGSTEEVSFEPGISAEWAYDDIKKFQGKVSRFVQSLGYLRFYLGWCFLVLRRLPSIIRHHGPIESFFLHSAKEARRKETLIKQRIHEIRILHRKLLYSKPEGFLTNRFLTTVTFLFDRDVANAVELYLTDSELHLTNSLRRFANSMLMGATSFGAAAILAFIAELLSQARLPLLFIAVPFLGLAFYICYGYGWFALIRGLLRFRQYFLIAKERENAKFAPDLRCPTCNSRVMSDWRHCIQCGSNLSALPLPRPEITIPPPAELDKLSVTRWERFVVSTRREYEGETVRIRRVIGSRVAGESDVLEFRQFVQHFLVGPEVLVDAYSEGDTYTSPEIIGLGRNIAIAEEKHIVECLLKGIANRTTVDTVTADTLVEVVRKFDLQPDAVFVPIDFVTPIMMLQLKGIRFTRKESEDLLSIGDIAPLPVIWSHQYVQFKEVIFLEKALGEWLFKPDENANQLWVNVASERKEGKFEVTVKSIAGYNIKNPRKGLVVDVRTSSE
jgi:hypothetical protein